MLQKICFVMLMVKITYNFVPNKVQSKLINIIRNKIFKSYREHYSFYFHTQKYTCTNIITKIFYVLYVGKNWRSLGDGWNNVYKHFIRLNSLNVFASTYLQLLQKYFTKHKNTLKIISIDTSFIYNKNGVDNLARNSYAKNKNCNKLFSIVDSNKKPIYFSLHKGSIHDSKIMTINYDKISNNLTDKNKYALADSAFDSNKIRNFFNEKNIIPLIPKNMRNTKKNFKMKDLTWEEKLEIYLKDFTDDERKIYRKRMTVENFYANVKQIHRFNGRYDKQINNLKGFFNIYFSGLLVDAA